MLSVPIVTPRSVLALGYKGLEADTLRNWHMLARKLSTEGENVTIVTYGGSLTAGFLAGDEGSWVEQLVVWLKVPRCVAASIACCTGLHEALHAGVSGSINSAEGSLHLYCHHVDVTVTELLWLLPTVSTVSNSGSL
jgi:hypothetical protein